MDRFWSKVKQDVDGNCMEWTAGKVQGGYGKFWLDGKTKLAHRVSYELEYGPIPEGLHIHHLCESKTCVNPDHLGLITLANHNTEHKLGNYRSECKTGHDLTVSENMHADRKCKACKIVADKKRRSTPEYRAKNAAYHRARRANLKGENQ